MKNNNIIKALISLAIIILFVTGCTSPQPVPAHDDTSAVGGELKEFNIIAKQWEFEPSTIEVNLGDVVDIHIKSTDVTHGFRLPDFGINEQLEPGKLVHVEFVADKKGTFPFSCSVPCGSGHGGMSGQLIVN